MGRNIGLDTNGDDAVYVDVDEVKGETEKALLCAIEGAEHWVPKSQITEDSEVTQKGDSGVLAISRWFAEANGLT